MSGYQKILQAGTNIILVDKGDYVEISASGMVSVAFSQITGDPYDNTALEEALNDKQDALTEGDYITMEDGTIDVTNFATDADIDALFE